jgi:two-component system phosphate regulon sensor histidine kinase PhoR
MVIQDLTRLRKLEVVRRDFVSNVSHELRTPLASLKLLTETLQEGALEDLPAARKFLIQMENEIDNLTQLVRELLELSRIESGRVPLERKAIAPCDVVSPAVERMEIQANRAGLQVKFECPTDMPDIYADPDRVEQVLVNLLHNAIKFTPPGGMITVSAYHDPGRVVFRVSDSGVGIAQADLERIFERFYKSDRARSSGGTGLGLSIARHIIESHGGKIWAESTPGSGSIFFFSIPTIQNNSFRD